MKITLFTTLQDDPPLALLVYQHGNLKGEIRFGFQRNITMIRNNINFIKAYTNKTLENQQVLIIGLETSEQLMWVYPSFNLESEMSIIELPEQLTAVIIKIASYVNLNQLIDTNYRLSRVEIDQLFQLKINQLQASLVNGKFKSLD
jgi:hypothetical protein